MIKKQIISFSDISSLQAGGFYEARGILEDYAMSGEGDVRQDRIKRLGLLT
jgi:hypothetical protein